MQPSKTILFLLLAVLLTSPTYARRTIEYRDIQLDIQVNKELSYAIAVIDKRDVVIKQSQGADFVGYIRSAAGIAFPISTESEKPFADDVTATIMNSIQASGASVFSVAAQNSMSREEIIENLKATGADKLILLTIDDWRSDTRSRAVDVATVMIWNLSVQILNTSGQIEAENKIEGRTDGMEPSFSASTKKIEIITRKYYKEKMEALFSKETIIEKMNDSV